MSRRLYLGRLPPDTRVEDVNKLFDGYGSIVDCRVMTGFGFVEFESPKDAEDAVNNFNGKPFLGTDIVVEFAKETRPRRERDHYEERSFGAPRSRRPPGVRLIVGGLSRDTSWQDLKDFGREAGNVSYADIDRDNAGQGVLEYLNRDDADRAVKDLDGKDLRGKQVTVTLDDSRGNGGPDNYRRDDRDRDYRGGGGRYRDDRRDDRYRDDRRDDRHERRRDRSRSPIRRGDDDRRPPRSPPPKRDDDRRGSGPEPERRNGRDDRRRDDREDRGGDRYEDRPSREGGWR